MGKDDWQAMWEFESECLKAVRERIKLEAAEDLARRGMVVSEVGLKGWPRETKLFIALKERGIARRLEWDIWDPSNFPPGTETPEPADAWPVATVILYNLIE